MKLCEHLRQRLLRTRVSRQKPRAPLPSAEIPPYRLDNCDFRIEVFDAAADACKTSSHKSCSMLD